MIKEGGDSYYKYTLKGKPNKYYSYKEINMLWQDERDRHLGTFLTSVQEGTLSPREAWQIHSNLLMKSLAKEMGLVYEREIYFR